MQSERTFIALTEKDFPPQERPSCPICGANHTVSNALRWQCQECGKQWNKINNARKANNPPCFWCGGKTHKKGTTYCCVECGRSRSVHLVDHSARLCGKVKTIMQ